MADQGEQGERGVDGLRGKQGDHGQQGDRGQAGATGAAGERGDTGLTGHGDQGERGKTGDTGQTGQTGQTGTAGAAGATGAQGVAAKLPKAQLVAFLIICGAFAWIVSGFNSTQKDIEQGQKAAQVDALRNCIRANIGAGIRQADGQSPTLFPIFDCKATIVDRIPKVLSREESKKYIAIVESGRFPIVNEGKVVGSRATLLEGVNSIEDAGKP